MLTWSLEATVTRSNLNGMLPPGVSLRPATLRHLPVIREAIDRLHIREVVDERVPPDPRNTVSVADSATVMILNVLHGRVALYEMGEWLVGTDIEVLLWEGCQPGWFHDDRLASALDSLWEAGTDRVVSEVARRWLNEPDQPTEYSVHTDTTSLMLQGAYLPRPNRDRPGQPEPAHGHSKDYRPDLLQLLYGMALHGPTHVPLCASMLDGNCSEQVANRMHIDTLALLLPDRHDVTLVADCKLVDPLTLGRARYSGFHYISLLPRSYNLHEELVEAARAVALSPVAENPGRRKGDPPRGYRSISFTRDFFLEDPNTEQRTLTPHRFLIVHSSQLATTFEEGRADRLDRERTSGTAAFRKQQRTVYACEADAQAVRTGLEGSAKFHAIDAVVEARSIPLPRSRRGRPRAGPPTPTEAGWGVTLRSITPDEAAIAHARHHASHFVLLPDHLDTQDWSDARVLGEYRAQDMIEGHTGFRWLKGVADVAPVFLHPPHRIAALGLVFLLALMVRNWIEGRIRAALCRTQEKLPNMNDQPTSRPTTEAAMRLFQFVTVLLVVRQVPVSIRDETMLQDPSLQPPAQVLERRVYGMSTDGEKVLRLLDMSSDIFAVPRAPPPWSCA
jgi:transposase